MAEDDPYKIVANAINTSENPYLASNARNPRSTATGNGQFIENTWIPLVSQQRPDLIEGKTREQILAMRADPNLSLDMTAAYARQNGMALQSAGIPVTPGSLYLAHSVGPGSAVSILKASPTTPIGAILGQSAIAANPSWQGQTAGSFLQGKSKQVLGRIIDTQMSQPDDFEKSFVTAPQPPSIATPENDAFEKSFVTAPAQTTADAGFEKSFVSAAPASPSTNTTASTFGQGLGKLASDVGRNALSFGAGAKEGMAEYLDPQAEFLAQHLGGNIVTNALGMPNGDQLRAADLARRQAYQTQYGNDVAANIGKISGNLGTAGAEVAGIGRLTGGAFLPSAMTSSLPAPIAAYGNAAVQGALGAGLGGGNPLIGAVAGGTANMLGQGAVALANSGVLGSWPARTGVSALLAYLTSKTGIPYTENPLMDYVAAQTGMTSAGELATKALTGIAKYGGLAAQSTAGAGTAGALTVPGG